MTRTFRTAAVIGAGTIGLSWTALFAAHGLTVRVSDPREDLAEAVTEALEQYAPHLAARGLDVTGLADRVRIAADVTDAVRGADVVQENAPERAGFKKDLFATLARLPGHRDTTWLACLLTAALIGTALARLVHARAAYRRLVPDLARPDTATGDGPYDS